ncbi:uncharacterized protein SCHCODRAFT_02628779 [Schizophyllum commune H4-8]|uniref:uncharacterized protein n=1 Tax=Schizophyllum commune (strain H4-8 / FGSC 9210) TaxID=578458 RepID=UPI0021604AC1|nr:uncharacterized protein SCHCODRAFT_02628779 [Schizophyllum commune H4-8]KAI5891329.1 hypothetical protein SCHCODRAFT_02628779 [Schizophyllum commune H4-8]
MNYLQHTHFEAKLGHINVRHFIEALHYFQELTWYRMNHELVAANNVPQWAQNMRNTLAQRITAARQVTQNKLHALQQSSTTISRIAAKAYNGAQGHGGGAHRYAVVAFVDGSLPTDARNGVSHLVNYGFNPAPNGNLPQGLPERRRALRDSIGARVYI